MLVKTNFIVNKYCHHRNLRRSKDCKKIGLYQKMSWRTKIVYKTKDMEETDLKEEKNLISTTFPQTFLTSFFTDYKHNNTLSDIM